MDSARGARDFQSLRTPGVGERMVLEENLVVSRYSEGCAAALTDAEMAYYGAFCHAAARGRRWRGRARSPSPVQPADVVAISEHYRERLPARAAKLLFTVAGILVTAAGGRRGRANTCPTWRSCHGPGLHSCRRTIRTRSARSWRLGARRSGERRGTTKGENHHERLGQ